jgi:hypothetical protein
MKWLHGNARCIEALNLDGRWQEVTDRCGWGSIPTNLVKEWSDRNQRALVTFRITL